MKHKIYKLKDVATITSGYSFRTKIQNNPEGDTYVIQMKDINEGKTAIINIPHMIDAKKVDDKHLLLQGDILFMGKGANNFAVCYDVNFKPAIAASAFFVIQPKQDIVNPKYLCWYINSRRAQSFIESNRAGSYIPNVNKRVLEELEIIIPPIDTQNSIAELSQLITKERNLISKLRDKREQIMNVILTNLIS